MKQLIAGQSCIERSFEMKAHWLVDNGIVVGYIKTLLRKMDGTPLTLCDIEVREGHRGNGYARDMISMIEQDCGFTMHSTGFYTPEGYAALGGKLPLVPGGDAGVKATSMTFVRDWDTMTAKYRF